MDTVTVTGTPRWRSAPYWHSAATRQRAAPGIAYPTPGARGNTGAGYCVPSVFRYRAVLSEMSHVLTPAYVPCRHCV